jgi:hypothetical protein
VEDDTSPAGRVRVRDGSGAERVVRVEDVEESEGATRVRVPTASAVRQPGFFHIGGAEDLALSGGTPDTATLRFYWNCSLAGSVALVQTLTSRLSEVQRPYHFKIVDDPQHFRRADNTVLYVGAADLDVFRPVVVETHEEVGHTLRPETPLFTKPLGRGLGFAQDPGDGQSFGMHRSRLVAEGLWDAYRLGRTTARGRLSAVLRRFGDEGVPADAPHLSTADSPYELDLELTDPTASLLSALG